MDVEWKRLFSAALKALNAWRGLGEKAGAPAIGMRFVSREARVPASESAGEKDMELGMYGPLMAPLDKPNVLVLEEGTMSSGKESKTFHGSGIQYGLLVAT